MFYTLLLTLTFFFAGAFLIVWFRTFDFKRLKNIWIVCKSRAIEKLNFLNKVKAAEAKGEKPFLYGNKGSIVIYAKDKKEANLKYQKLLLKETKANARILSKKK